MLLTESLLHFQCAGCRLCLRPEKPVTCAVNGNRWAFPLASIYIECCQVFNFKRGFPWIFQIKITFCGMKIFLYRLCCVAFARGAPNVTETAKEYTVKTIEKEMRQKNICMHIVY